MTPPESDIVPFFIRISSSKIFQVVLITLRVQVEGEVVWRLWGCIAERTVKIHFSEVLAEHGGMSDTPGASSLPCRLRTHKRTSTQNIPNIYLFLNFFCSTIPPTER